MAQSIYSLSTYDYAEENHEDQEAMAVTRCTQDQPRQAGCGGGVGDCPSDTYVGGGLMLFLCTLAVVIIFSPKYLSKKPVTGLAIQNQ